MLGKFYYPVVFLHEEDGITVTFPDFDYLLTCGATQNEAYEKAEECLGIGIRDAIEEGREVAHPTEMKNITLEEKEQCAIVSVDMDQWIDEHDKRTIKRNITIPKWLDVLAKKKEINISGVCQKALMEELNVKRY